MNTNESETEEKGVSVTGRVFKLLIVGMVLVFIGTVILVIASLFSAGSGSVGVVIFIGPFPIVFGAGPNAVWLILIGIILAIVSLVLFLVMNRRLGKFTG